MMNTELEGVLECDLGGLEDRRGNGVRDRDAGILLLDGCTGVLVRVRVRVGVLDLDGMGDRDGVADGHRKVPLFPAATKRVQDPTIGPEAVPARH